MHVHRLVSLVLWVFTVSGLSLPVHAQTARPPARTEICLMSWEVDQTGLFITENDRDYTLITAPAYEFGGPVFVRAGAPVRIYEQVQKSDGIEYVAVGEAELPPDCRTAQVYLIRKPDLDGRRDYRVIALSNDAKAFGAGKVRLFNFSPWLAGILINGVEQTLPPLEWRIVDVVPDRKHRVIMQAALQFGDGSWTSAVRDLVTLRENYRGSVTFLHTRRSFDETDLSPVLPEARMLIQTTSEYLYPQSGGGESTIGK